MLGSGRFPIQWLHMVRLLVRCVVVLVGLALVIYIADAVTWRVKLAHGKGTDQVKVTRVSVATLKSSKEEYYFDGVDTMECTRSMLPPPTASGWGTPCWWLRGHHQVVTRY